MNNLEKIKQAHLQFAEDRGFDKTYCPSEIARELFPQNWREKMDVIREIGDQLVIDGKLEILQKGIIQKQPSTELKGPIRFRKK